jgi:hypothetical protein
VLQIQIAVVALVIQSICVGPALLVMHPLR